MWIESHIENIMRAIVIYWNKYFAMHYICVCVVHDEETTGI